MIFCLYLAATTFLATTAFTDLEKKLMFMAFHCICFTLTYFAEKKFIKGKEEGKISSYSFVTLKLIIMLIIRTFGIVCAIFADANTLVCLILYFSYSLLTVVAMVSYKKQIKDNMTYTKEIYDKHSFKDSATDGKVSEKVEVTETELDLMKSIESLKPRLDFVNLFLNSISERLENVSTSGKKTEFPVIIKKNDGKTYIAIPDFLIMVEINNEIDHAILKEARNALRSSIQHYKEIGKNIPFASEIQDNFLLEGEKLLYVKSN